ncbi:MAG TPA: hypothetical protein VMR97_00015 [Acidimicrobiales bacterium]|nr:hypothetical protein [Acidimicrobiales bacterium]
MRPFQEFRLWARRAPVSERVGAVAGAAVVLAALLFLVSPGSQSNPASANSAPGRTGGNSSAAGSNGASSSGTSTAGTAAGSASASGGGGTAGGSPGAAGSAGGGATSAAAAGCPSGSDQGVSATQLRIAITLVNIFGPAANNAFGIPTTTQQEAIFNTIISSVNASGGICGRKIVPVYFQANPADPTQTQQVCLQVVQAGVFAVLDPGSYSQTSPLCFSQNQIPYFGGYILTEQQQNQGYPYLFDLGSWDHLLKDTVFGFQSRGEFNQVNGFKKLGIFYHDCHPELINEELGWLQQAGVQSSQIVTYDFGCPTAFANPNDVQEAILKFESSGVNDVTDVNAEGDWSEFTNTAQGQGFHPQYLIPDEELLGISGGADAPNSSNLANALAVTASRNGENDTPGITPTPGTQKCNAIMQSGGLPPVYQQEQLAGDACNEIWMLQAAVQHAPVLQRNALAAGIQAAGSVDFSYPGGPNDFSGDHVTTAGEFWRVDQFFETCTCWRVIDPTFHPNY